MASHRHHHVPERFLRQLWKHKQFETTDLSTTDGKQIEILSPGILNTDGGPDFSDALIRIGGILYRGTVELHQHFDEWTTHSHHLDPKYNAVILHVVLHGHTAVTANMTESNRLVPVLVLDRYLTQSYRETWDAMILSERAERLSTIKCYSGNDGIESSTIHAWLEKLAVERVELKVRRFEERLKELSEEKWLHLHEPPPRYQEIPFGLNPEDLPSPLPSFSPHDFNDAHLWEQLLYEGIMEALGYTKNQQPFLTLARNVRLQFLVQHSIDASSTDAQEKKEAILFAAAGLLPSLLPTMEKESKRYLTMLKRHWKEIRTSYHGSIVNEAEWQFFRLRPENFPTVRIAGAARLISRLFEKNFFKLIIQLIKHDARSVGEQYNALRELLVVPSNGFWSNHYRFGEPARLHLKTLIGKSRADEIILNAVIPVCMLYARIFKDKAVREGALKLYKCSPVLSENTITRTIVAQLLKGKLALDSAMLQQGALQLYKFYCVEERCTECAVGRKVFE
ncbi:MAG: DUF2851 family protein [Ignavibacteriae bacterium]|nr:DUF2851 family protein [Ignavibacteriota bacterium]